MNILSVINKLNAEQNVILKVHAVSCIVCFNGNILTLFEVNIHICIHCQYMNTSHLYEMNLLNLVYIMVENFNFSYFIC